MLGMTFRTDVSIVRFTLKEDAFEGVQNLAQNREADNAIRALKEALLTEINAAFELEEEVSAGYRRKDTGDNEQQLVVDLFFYDEVSGGAGLCTSIFAQEHQDLLKSAVDNTLLRLSGHSCSNGTGCDRVCIGCLLDFRNSMDHDFMDRKHGLRLLRWLLNEQELPKVETCTDEESSAADLADYAALIQCREATTSKLEKTASFVSNTPEPKQQPSEFGLCLRTYATKKILSWILFVENTKPHA